MKDKAFSLIELLVALSILGIISAIILPRFLNIREEAGKAALLGNLARIQKAHQNWYSLGGLSNGATPTELLQFFSTPGQKHQSTRIAGNPARDDPTAAGSWYISLNVSVNTSPPAVEGFNDLGDADGLFYNSTDNKRYRILVSGDNRWSTPDL